MSINDDAEFSDVLEDVMLQGVVTVGTSEVELIVGASANEDREVLRIYNSGDATIYVGPSGVTPSTGEPLKKKQSMEMPLGASLSLYAVTSTGTSDVIVWELG